MTSKSAPDQVTRALTVAAAASALEGHDISPFVQETIKRRLLGELSSEEAVRVIAEDAVRRDATP